MEGERRSRLWCGVRIGLTGRILILVIFAVVPALVIQAWNEYDLRIAREADIRQQVVQITKQFGEEIGDLCPGVSLTQPYFENPISVINGKKYEVQPMYSNRYHACSAP